MNCEKLALLALRRSSCRWILPIQAALTSSFISSLWLSGTDNWNECLWSQNSANRDKKTTPAHWRLIRDARGLLKKGRMYHRYARCTEHPKIPPFCLSLWIVFQKTCVTLLTNQIQNKNQSRLGHPRFPALWTVHLFFSLTCDWLVVIFSFHLIGCCDYFGFGLQHPIEIHSMKLINE